MSTGKLLIFHNITRKKETFQFTYLEKFRMKIKQEQSHRKKIRNTKVRTGCLCLRWTFSANLKENFWRDEKLLILVLSLKCDNVKLMVYHQNWDTLESTLGSERQTNQ